MRNVRLERAMHEAGVSVRDLSVACQVDPKTVERWITQGREPHRRTRRAVAQVLDRKDEWLWPSTADQADTQTELVRLWPTRAGVPTDVWGQIASAESQLDILVYSGGFLIEAFGILETIRRVSGNGGAVRFCLGDPDSAVIQERGAAERLPSLPARARSSAEYLQPVTQLPGVEVRMHAAPLYASLFRGDDVLLANLHTHGGPAVTNPVLQLRHIPDEPLFEYYLRAFERVWEQATTLPVE